MGGGRRGRDTERERLPVLNYSRMGTSQKQSCWSFRIYRKLLLVGIMCEMKMSIKYGFNGWFWLFMTALALCLLGLVALFCGQGGNHWQTKGRNDPGRCALCGGVTCSPVHRGQILGSRRQL